MIKRVCDSCDNKIEKNEEHYVVEISRVYGNQEDSPIEYSPNSLDVCSECKDKEFIIKISEHFS